MKAIERLYQYIEYKGFKPTPLEKKIGLSNGYLGKMLVRKADIGSSILSKIIENCPDLDLTWLITGKGNMIKEDTSSVNILQEPTTPYIGNHENVDRLLEEKDNEINRLMSIIKMITGETKSTPKSAKTKP